MKQYIGTKMVMAEPALEPEIKFNRRQGYKVVYPPDGYESWSPRDVFENAYRETTGMNFGLALEACKMGEKIARTGWNGKGMYVFLAHDPDFNAYADIPEFDGLEDVQLPDVLVMKTAQGAFHVGWLASQADMLADDWCIVE